MTAVQEALTRLLKPVLEGQHALNALLAAHGARGELGPGELDWVHDVLTILKGARNGAVYGAKVRFPHALVMTYLFRTGTHADKWKGIVSATRTHSLNLMMFVTLYKTMMLTFRRIRGGHERSVDAFAAGTIGGYIVFGNNTAVANQIVLYLFSRIMVGLAKTAVKRTGSTAPAESFPVFAALTWGCVMWLFRHERDTLQGSLQTSMHYLYNNAETFNNLGDWMWHNKR